MLNIKDENSFLIDQEKDITSQYLKQGYYIGPVADKAALSWSDSVALHTEFFMKPAPLKAKVCVSDSKRLTK